MRLRALDAPVDRSTAAAGNRDIFFTEDVGLAAGNFVDALTSRVGPFLQQVEDTLIDPATGLPFVPSPVRPAAQPLVLPFNAGGFIPGVSRHFRGDGVTPREVTATLSGDTSDHAEATFTAADIIRTTPVVNGAWQFQGTATCSTPISIQSTLGTKVQNIPVQVK